MRVFATALVLLATSLGCGSGDSGAPAGNAAATIMSWNVQGLGAAEPERALGIAERIGARQPDLIALQECPGCTDDSDVLPSGYQLAAPATAGVSLAYDTSRWSLQERGRVHLGSNDDGWGDRLAVWGRFVHRTTRRPVVFYSTHWCVPVRAADDACDAVRQSLYAQRIVEHASAFDDAATVIAGDLNVWEHDDRGPLLALAKTGVRPLADAYRSIHDSGEAHTFAGNHFAKPGRLDYIFVSDDVQVVGADELEMPYAQELHSDHRPVVTRVLIADR